MTQITTRLDLVNSSTVIQCVIREQRAMLFWKNHKALDKMCDIIMLCLHVFFSNWNSSRLICVSFLFSAVGDQRAVQQNQLQNQPGKD